MKFGGMFPRAPISRGQSFFLDDISPPDPLTLSTITTTSRITVVMAEQGIDRKAEERMEFTTSKDVTVCPTFADMHLKGMFSCNASFNHA